MKFRYDEAKNANLLATRGIGFEEIILEIKNGNLLDILCSSKTVIRVREIP